MEPSGPIWCSRYPTSKLISDLELDFGRKVTRFVGVLEDGGAIVIVSATRRPKQRAYLMHWSWAISVLGVDPASVPPMDGVDIQWDHDNAREAARQMVLGYGMAHQAVLDSLHIEGEAIDMTITWDTPLLSLRDPQGNGVTVSGERDGMNPRLWEIGAMYGVIKLPSDRPHWSKNGH